MRPNGLPIAVKNSQSLLLAILPHVVRGAPKLIHYERVSSLYRRMAVGSLLLACDVGSFRWALSAGARASLYYVQNAPVESQATGRCEGFYDAVACRDEACVQELARLARRTPNPQLEYEEDFLHVRFLMDLHGLSLGREALVALLERWEAVAVEAPDPRSALCRALLDRDQGAFDAALARCIEREVGELERKRTADTLHPDDAPTVAHVSTRVLAWLEIAERRGLSVPAEVALAPSVARLFGPIRLAPPDAWREMSGLRAPDGGELV